MPYSENDKPAKSVLVYPVICFRPTDALKALTYAAVSGTTHLTLGLASGVMKKMKPATFERRKRK